MTTQPYGYNPEETQTHDRLPREHLRTVSVRRMVLEWVVAVAVVLAVNAAAFAALDKYDPNRFRVQVKVKYELLRERGGQYDSLILGDSTPNQGVIPRQLDEQIGGKWFNISTVANLLAMSDAWFLEEFIDSYGPPKEVLICHVPDMWPREIDPAVLAQAQYPVAGFDTLNPPLNLSLHQELDVYLTRYAPLYAKNESLRKLALKPWEAEDLRDAFGEDGFMALTGQEDGWREHIEIAKIEHKDQPFSVSEINERSMRRVIELAEEHGFVVYLLPGTASEGLALSAGYRRNFELMMQAYRTWGASSDHLTVLLPEPQVYKDELMYDEDHVNIDGAKLWTEDIAQAILEARRRRADQ